MASLVQLADMLWMDDRGGARGALEEARHIALALTAGQPDGSRAAADLELVDQRLSGLARGLGNADLRLFRVEHGRRIPLGPRDQPAVRATIAAVTRTPPGWTDYLLVFGAEGPAQLLDRSSAADREWTLTAAGPPPTQTVVLISLPAPLSDAAKRQLLADVAAVGDRRVVEADEHVSWAFNEPRVESTASPRGARRIGWVEAVRDRLAGLGTLAVAGHTFSLRVGLGSRPGP
jgi:hypothetical protein